MATKEIRIKTLTPNAARVVKKHLNESSRGTRFLFSRLFKVEITDDNPEYFNVVRLVVKNPAISLALEPEDLIVRIDRELEAAGLEKMFDYETEAIR